MKKIIITFLCAISTALILVGCTRSPWLYRVPIQQGNFVSAEIIQKLHAGMTKEAVCDLIGPPVLMNTFDEHRWDYIYTFKPNKGKLIQRTLIIYFKNDRVKSFITKNV